MKRTTLLAALLVLAIIAVILVTSAFSFKFSLPSFGRIVVQQDATTCNESDSGVLFYTKGAVSLCTGASCVVKGEDFCTDDTVTEYYCSEQNEIKTVNLRCPYGCDDGACMTIGQTPKPKPELPKVEEEVKKIICDEGWTCVSKTKVYQDVDCSWIKEEYCKYGCTSGECTNPAFWKKFLFWLQGQVI
jgi:hypothetical protein